MKVYWKVVAVDPANDTVIVEYSSGSTKINWGIKGIGDRDLAELVAKDAAALAYLEKVMNPSPHLDVHKDKSGEFEV